MRKMLLAAIAAFTVSPALSAEWTMTCQNPRQAYLVVFDDKAQTLILDPDTSRTAYEVVAVADQMVSGNVGHDSGLQFVADYGNAQMRYYGKDDFKQVDACKVGP